ncbi:MAG TPA: DUF4340 domain-containing protein [Opitutales bacterium]|jgi:hypothetical protein|nr:DUF4340 domain-containing protein [Opitutales bacterium]
MRFKLTIFLLLANLAVFFVLWRLDQPATLPPKGPPVIDPGFIPNHITIHTFNNAQKATLELSSNDELHWSLVQPLTWPANDDAVKPIYVGLQHLDVGANITPAELKDGGQTIKDFGLDQPIADITLQDQTHKQTLLVGHPTARGSNIYVMNPDDGIVRVIDQNALTFLNLPVESYRDNTIFSTDFFGAQSLSIRVSNAGTLKLVQFVANGDDWKLDTPVSRPADRKAISSVISQLDSLHITDFPTGTEADQARASLATPKLKVELKDSANHSTSLSIGDDVPNARIPEVYAQLNDNPTVFTLPKTDLLIITLPQAQDKLRDHTFLDFIDMTKVTALGISSATGSVRLERQESGPWQVDLKQNNAGAPVLASADPAIIQALLQNLSNLTAKNFTSDAPGDLAPYGLTNPLRKVVFHTDHDITLDIGFHGESPNDALSYRYYAKVEGPEGTDSIYEIDGSILDSLDDRPLSYRDRILEQLPTAATIIGIKLTHITDGKELFNFTLPANTTWADYTAAQSSLNSVSRSSLLDILDYVKKFHVAPKTGYRQMEFSTTYHLPATAANPVDVDVPWLYRLDAVVQLPATGATPSPSLTLTFYFSARLLPFLQIGGTPGEPSVQMPAAIFDLTQDLLGDLKSFTDVVDLSPAVQQTLGQLNQPITPAAVPADASATATAAPAPSAASSTATAP